MSRRPRHWSGTGRGWSRSTATLRALASPSDHQPGGVSVRVVETEDGRGETLLGVARPIAVIRKMPMVIE